MKPRSSKNAPNPILLLVAWEPKPSVSDEVIWPSSIAVTPFINPEPSDELLADEVTMKVEQLLAEDSAFEVVACAAVEEAVSRGLDTHEIGNELSVAYVIEGNAQQRGDQVRVTVQLIKTESGMHLWSDTYAGERDNVDYIAATIAKNVSSETGSGGAQ